MSSIPSIHTVQLLVFVRQCACNALGLNIARAQRVNKEHYVQKDNGVMVGLGIYAMTQRKLRRVERPQLQSNSMPHSLPGLVLR